MASTFCDVSYIFNGVNLIFYDVREFVKNALFTDVILTHFVIVTRNIQFASISTTINQSIISLFQVYCALKPCNLNTPVTDCYTGIGIDYKGKTDVSQSGRKCWKWNSVTPRYSNIDHSYCRNFIGDLDEPWCYVADLVRERCSVPHCNDFHQGSHGSATARNGNNGDDDDSSKLVTYVVPFIVGMTVLLFSFFLFAFYWKNKKLMQQKNGGGGDVLVLEDRHPRLIVNPTRPDELAGVVPCAPGSGGGLMMNNKTNTLSTNASSARSLVDFNSKSGSNGTVKEFNFVSSSAPSSCNSNTPPLEIRHQQNKRYKKVIFEFCYYCFQYFSFIILLDI